MTLPPTNAEIGAALRYIREERTDLSASEASRRLGYCRTAVGNWERATARPPFYSVCEALALYGADLAGLEGVIAGLRGRAAA
jgi:transcriptional regulator with XRE-family HTH domain